MNLLPLFKYLRLLLAFVITILLATNSAKAQCYPDFYVYQSYPYGALCSPQYATARAESYSAGTWSFGEFRWYSSETDPYPVQSTYLYYGDPAVSDYSLYASNGTTVWVSFFNYNTYCESERVPYTFYVSPTPNLYQDYAKKCGAEPAKIQLSSNVSGVYFELYKLSDTYDPYYGNTQTYELQQSNTTGYFEIYDFNPTTEYSSYYAKVSQSYGCSTPYYYPLFIEATGVIPLTITGNLSVNAGSSTTLTVTGDANNYKWYNQAGTLLQTSYQYTTPTTLTPDYYPYTVVGVSSDEGCVTSPAVATVTVNGPGTTYTSLYNSSNFTKQIDLGKPVGIVDGTAGTSPSGAVTYSIPISEAPGTNGLEPSISVNYNSQSGNGIAGFGWNIAGLSVINRSGKDIYHNGIVSPMSFTDGDGFYLDGVYLNPISGSNGANGTIYAQEAENFSKIISNTTSSSSNPDWFQVTSKDGTIMEFGHTTDSRLLTETGSNVISWRLSKMIDRNGNYVEFKYDNGFRDSRIKEISYTGNSVAGLSPYNKLIFNYVSRTDVGTQYQGGAALVSKFLLDNITVTSKGQTASIYQFNYGYDNVCSLLKEVVKKGSDGTTALNSTIFLYGDQSQVIHVSQTVTLTGNYDYFSGDFNADGKTDLLAGHSVYSGTVGIRLHDSYSAISDIAENSYTLLYSKSLPTTGTSVIFQGKRFANFLTSDYDGDGRDDILQVNSTKETFFCTGEKRKITDITLNYSRSHNPSTGYTDHLEQTNPYPTDWLGKQYQYVSDQGNYFIPGDFDGDGNQDYILILAAKRLNGTCTGLPKYDFDYKAFATCPSKGEVNQEILNFGFGANPNPDYYAKTIAEADQVTPVDIDGDGKSELLITKGSTSYVLSITRLPATTGFSFGGSVLFTTPEVITNSRIFPGDFNGDGRGDFLIKNPSGTWKIIYSTGTTFVASFFTFNQTPNVTGVYSDDKIIVSDFNGDGKSDILHGYTYQSGARFSLYYSRGNNNATSFYYEQYSYNGVLAYDQFTVGDFNGDGRSDILNRPNISSPADFISFNPFSKEHLLVKATNGHNSTTSFDYRLLTDKTSYPYFHERTVSLDDPSNQNPINYVELPVYAVQSLVMPDGNGGSNTSLFSYENAAVHRTAKGFLGFKKVTTKNLSTGMTSVSENEINSQFGVPYPVKEQMLLTSTSELLSESSLNTSFVNLSSGSNKRYFFREDKILTEDKLTGTAKEEANTYDNFGNITTKVVKKGSLSGSTVTPVETQTTTTAFGVHNTPVAALPENITTAQTRAGMATQTSVTTLTYNTEGNCASQTIFYGLPKAVTNTFGYDNFGNTTSVIASAASIATVTRSTVFDNEGRFAISKVISGSGISQTETFTYDGKWGAPLTQTTTDCLTTSFEYDKFGRVNKTTLPDANFKNTSLNWDVQSGNIYYKLDDYLGGKPDVKQWYDLLNRPTKTQTAGFNNQWLTSLVTYDIRGNIATQSNNYYSVETPIVTTRLYDNYNRLLSATNSLGTTSKTYTKLSNGKVQVSTTAGGKNTSNIMDAAGRIISAIDNGGLLEYTYDSRGNQVEIKHEGLTVMTKTYDAYGRQSSVTDKNAGTVTYEYDAKGLLKQQTDNAGNTYNMTYDDLGRLTSRQGPDGTTLYEYFKDIATGCSNNNIAKTTNFNGIIKVSIYDNLKRLQSEAVTLDGSTFTTQYSYDAFSNLNKIIYPSSVEVNNIYNMNGQITSVTGGTTGSPVTLFTASQMDGFGNYTQYALGNNITSQDSYTKGFPVRFFTSGVQDLKLSFDEQTGNLTSREDALKSLTETFEYDNLDRLTSTSLNNVVTSQLQYDGNSSSSMGNIKSKTDAGNYVYNTQKINAVNYILNPAGAQTAPAVISVGQQDLTYTPFLKTGTVAENNYQWSFEYGADLNRVKSVLKLGGTEIERKYYLGNYEKQTKGLTTREIYYVSGGAGLCAILVKEGSTVIPHYVYTDHLGSIVTVTNSSGVVEASQNFDAWGRSRNPNTWQYVSVPTQPDWLYRGYTGHEQIVESSLINMNGRMYDPVVGRMLSPDNYVQDPYNTQSFNRYSYTINNPLKYTDPTGNFFAWTVLSATLDFLNAGLNEGGFAVWNWGSERFRSAWRNFDPTRRGSQTNNAFRIDMGRFKSNRKTFAGKAFQVLLRHTWESAQTETGNVFAHVRNITGYVASVDYYEGATLVNRVNPFDRDRWGITLGPYINSQNLTPDPFHDNVFRHEYGHTIQSRIIGPLYLTQVGVPSFAGALINGEDGHSTEWYETGANRLAKRYFEQHSPEVFDPAAGGTPWDLRENPTNYNPNWYWFFSSPGPEWAWWLAN